MLRFCMLSLMQDGSGANGRDWKQPEHTAHEEAVCTLAFNLQPCMHCPPLESEQLHLTCWSQGSALRTKM